VKCVLEHEEAVTALSGYFELERAHSQPARLAEAIGARRDPNDKRHLPWTWTLIHTHLPPYGQRWPTLASLVIAQLSGYHSETAVGLCTALERSTPWPGTPEYLCVVDYLRIPPTL
jgi:hypothetical protein